LKNDPALDPTAGRAEFSARTDSRARRPFSLREQPSMFSFFSFAAHAQDAS